MRRQHLALTTVFLSLSSVAVFAENVLPIIHFGDSVTFGLRDTGVNCDVSSSAAGYPPRLKEELNLVGWGIEALNEGLCGEYTSGAVHRIESVLEEHPDARILLLMEGTNDITLQIGIETIRDNLASIASKAADSGVETVYGSIIPRGPNTSPDTYNSRTSDLDTLIRELAEHDGRPFAAIFEWFESTPHLFERYYHSDGYHPNVRGYDLLTQPWREPTIEALEAVVSPEPCAAGGETLCLGDGERFRVEVDWVAHDGEDGSGQAIPFRRDTGEFWFFDESNIELILKVIDARCYNESFWVFYGALTDVQYSITVTDTVRGRRRVYRNVAGNLASFGDTAAFMYEDESDEVCGRSSTSAPPRPSSKIPLAPSSREDTNTKPCSDHALCLNQDRFEVRVTWLTQSGDSGSGQAIPQTEDTGAFWFFDPENVELVVKVLDGRNLTGSFWVFYGALTDVEFTLSIRDTETGATVEYFNPMGAFGSNADTLAFPEG